MGNTEQYLDWARRVLRTEALGLNEIADALDGGFVRAADAVESPARSPIRNRSRSARVTAARSSMPAAVRNST